MKVLIITTLYPSQNSDSVKNISFAVHDLVRNINDHNVEVVKVINPDVLIEWRKCKLRIKNTNAIFDGIKVNKRSFFNLPFFGIFPLFTDRAFLNGSIQGVDLVIAHMPLGASLAYYINKKYKIPYMYVAHKADIFNYEKNKKIFDHAKCVYTRSHALKRLAEKLGIKVKGIIYSGIDKIIINTKKKLNADHLNSLKIISVCNLQKTKNIDVVLEALSLLPKSITWKYTIIGDGEEYNNILNTVIGLGVQENVEMLGHREKSFCIGEMKKSDIFAMPSAPETFGVAYLEAMASGCIVIGSEGWGIDGILTNNINGYLVKPRSVEALLDVFKIIYSTPQGGLVNNSLRTIKEYTYENASKNYVKAIFNCL